MTKVLAIIPARYASTRFPGKPLALLGGKPVIQWVWNRVSAIPELADAVVATDDERIAEAVRSFGGKVIMTSSTHRSGTDRCGEVLAALESQGNQYDIVINVQGDEPFVQPEQIRSLITCFTNSQTQIATLRTPITDSQELFNPNNVKVVCDLRDNALYFSRQPLPHLRGIPEDQWLQNHTFYKHVGLYAFRTSTLKEVTRLPQSPLEQRESLEQLRWLENGYTIRLGDSPRANVGIDTPEDLAAAEQQLLKQLS
ncbi:MAG: 3-deoxy-manno-octulosonate cytidylyltransferase [Bacteroidales bacterium]|nr:3-deoxy-manno-octulosonate cytidylyltransferase [Bacteroidales bacterium]MBR3411667.1 3-deoxy-manno-octulosonate cytidylyltransferase [Bacteroidales bacterium]